MSGILSYYDFTGENIDGEYIEVSTLEAVTEEEAKNIARLELKYEGGGHIDAWYAETGEFAFDVEV
jgi:hypothetical protein